MGNPGRRFIKTRHNIGFMVVEKIAKDFSLKFRRHFSLKAKIAWLGEREREVFLVKPLTYMNNSGIALKKIINKFLLPYKNILVVCDDLNLELGRLRLRRRGSAGGHKGLLSIIESLETEDFPRLRIGIGKPSREVSSYVLSEFSQEEIPVIRKTVDKASHCCKEWLKGGNIEVLMSRFNTPKDEKV